MLILSLIQRLYSLGFIVNLNIIKNAHTYKNNFFDGLFYRVLFELYPFHVQLSGECFRKLLIH